jgi:MGT family glycosyltransferase
MTRSLRVLFTLWEGGGNVTPTLEVARKLVARGHRVHVLSDACNRPEAEAVGASFTPWHRAPSRPDRRRDSQAFRDWAEATPQDGLLSVIRDIWCGPSLAYAQDVVDELRREPADLVVTSECLFGVMAGCESVGQRFVTLGPNISLAPLPGVPPLGPGLPPARTDAERAMHAEIAKACQGMFDAGLPALNATRAALELPPLAHLVDQYRAAACELLATSGAFDFPADPLPSRVRYVGPQISDPAWARPWVSPWSASDERPLVAVAFSTTFQNHSGVVQKVIDALAHLPARVLVTLGGSLHPDEVRPGPNCVVVESAPHTIVMREAALLVTHGGHGTVMRGLVSRVPMLVIPHGRDQNDNAVRVTERGAGLSLMPDASAEAIRAACERLLRDPRFREDAKRLGDRVAADAERSTVVEELEGICAAAGHLEEPAHAHAGA